MTVTLVYWMMGYAVVLNGYSFLLMGFDKRRSRRGGGQRRVPEKRFFLLAAIGGALGVWLGMQAWRHKTQHRAFTVGIPYLIAVNLVIVILLAGLFAMKAA